MPVPSIDDLRAAQARIEGGVCRTPLLRCPELEQHCDAKVRFKCENLQWGGAFKLRGATNAIRCLSDEQTARGVVTHSSGNHAAAVARAARQRDISVTVIMPTNSRRNKQLAVRRLGVEPQLCEPSTAGREAAAADVIHRTGATLVHPYNQPEIIAGQGTVVLEMVEQFHEQELAPPDVLLIPVGGGGLLSGSLIAAKSLWPETRVIATEPEWADDAARSLRSGRIEQNTRFDSVADGLRTALGDQTYPIIARHLDGIEIIGENAIIEATRWLLDRTGLLIEPSAALPVAALLANPERFSDQSVAVILTGGNLDFDALPWE